jgi:hypothetical protein
LNADELEVVPGFEHRNLQGQVFQGTDEELRDALEKAFDYRGDVTITLKNGSTVEGYVFDRDGTRVRLLTKGISTKLSIEYVNIGGLAFTGRDTAAGKSWEAWVKKYWEKKRAGETNIELVPEKLD